MTKFQIELHEKNTYWLSGKFEARAWRKYLLARSNYKRNLVANQLLIICN